MYSLHTHEYNFKFKKTSKKQKKMKPRFCLVILSFRTEPCDQLSHGPEACLSRNGHLLIQATLFRLTFVSAFF